MSQSKVTQVITILTFILLGRESFANPQMGAPPEINASESTPELDVSRGPKIMILKGTIEGQQMNIKETEIVQGYAPNQFFEDQDFQVELLDSDQKIMKTVGFKDPRVVRVIDNEGPVYIREKAEFSMAMPYFLGSTSLRIKALKQPYLPSQELINRGVRPEHLRLPNKSLVNMEIKPMFQKFCIGKLGDADCDFLIQGKVPSLKTKDKPMP